MRNRLVLAPLLLALAPFPADADTVYLLNGRSFEGVIAEVTDSQVRIRMQGGVLSLPKSQVLRVEESDSDYGEYLRRKAALQRAEAPQAADWLELARWAKARGLQQASRESGLEAAAIDPGLAGLEPLLRGHGYVLDKDLDRWIPYADSMRRRGFIQSNGQWITREEHAARQQQQRDQEVARLKAARDAADAARVAREAELAVAELELRTERLRTSTAPQAAYGYGVPMYVVPGYFAPPLIVVPGGWSHGGSHHHRPRPSGPPSGGRGGHRPSTGGDSGRSSYLHQPGSLIPGRLVPKSTN